MKYLICERCNCRIEQTSKGCFKYESLYFCCEECFHEYIDWCLEGISQRDFEMYGEDEETKE